MSKRTKLSERGLALVEQQNTFAEHMAKLIEFAQSKGFMVSTGEALRTKYQQREYMRRGLSRTMNSRHLVKQAIDLNFFIKYRNAWRLTYLKDDLQEIGDFWESLDEKNSWGGNWKSFQDTPHFERNA